MKNIVLKLGEVLPFQKQNGCYIVVQLIIQCNKYIPIIEILKRFLGSSGNIHNSFWYCMCRQIIIQTLWSRTVTRNKELAGASRQHYQHRSLVDSGLDMKGKVTFNSFFLLLLLIFQYFPIIICGPKFYIVINI